jgi:hypothetical protein
MTAKAKAAPRCGIESSGAWYFGASLRRAKDWQQGERCSGWKAPRQKFGVSHYFNLPGAFQEPAPE